jgi:PPOX class probable F420-dependent enzyme
MGSEKLAQFSGKYINLETYRKSGQGVSTPVWFVTEGDRIIVVTRSETGKVKRLHNNDKVKIMPSGMRGEPQGEWVEGRARFLDKEELDRALKARSKKYGFQARLAGLFSSTKGELVGISIALD